MRIKNWLREIWRRAKAILKDIHGEINIPKEKSKCIAEWMYTKKVDKCGIIKDKQRRNKK